VDDRSFCERVWGERVKVVGDLCWRLCGRGAPLRDRNLVVGVQLGRTLGIGAEVLTFASSPFGAGFSPTSRVCSFLLALLRRFSFAKFFGSVVSCCGTAYLVGAVRFGGFLVLVLVLGIRVQNEGLAVGWRG
jgi:hypothetical protein